MAITLQSNGGGNDAPLLPEVPAGMRAPLPTDAEAAQTCAHVGRGTPLPQPASDADCSAHGLVKLRSSALAELSGDACEQPALLVPDHLVPPDVPSTPPNDPPERTSRVASAPVQSDSKFSANPVLQQPIAKNTGSPGAPLVSASGLEQGSGQGLPPLRAAASPLRRRLRCWRGARRVRLRVPNGACAEAPTGGAPAAASSGPPWGGRASLLNSLAPADMAAPALVFEPPASADMAAPALLGSLVAGQTVACCAGAGVRSAAHALPPPAAAAPGMRGPQSTSGACVATLGRGDVAAAGGGVAIQQPGAHLLKLMPLRHMRSALNLLVRY